MPDDGQTLPPQVLTTPDDIGAYCRQVEMHLTRLNGGHLVRIVGPGFDLVRQWAVDGIPLSVVVRGIERKVARHQAGVARRPLRIEFCEADVREVFAEWRRAVGVFTEEVTEGASVDAETRTDSPAEARRAAMLALDRAIERLTRAAGHLEWPERLREVIGARLETLTAIRREARAVRGDPRGAILARVADEDASFSVAVREAAPSELVSAVRADALRDLAPYRGRLAASDWTKAVEGTADRLLRDRLGLPI